MNDSARALLRMEQRRRWQEGDRLRVEVYLDREPALKADAETAVELGRGGMGIVYRARQIALKRVVALKMILAGSHDGPKERASFRTEAEAIARLQHPNIVQIYDIAEHDGLPYFSLEFVDGPSLD